MKLERVLFFALSVLLLTGAFASAQDEEKKAAELYAKTLEYLKGGDFDAAFDAIRAAEELAPGNKDYSELAMEMRLVREPRSLFLDGMMPDRKCEEIDETLHSFYKRYKVYDEMLALDLKVHERLKNGFSTYMLADTYLCTGAYEDALKLLNELDPDSMTLEHKILQGIALIRLDRKREAVKLKSELQIPREPSEKQLVLLARFYALLGLKKRAVTLLTQCIEGMPDERVRKLCKLKRSINVCKDFDAVRHTRSFKRMLEALEKALNPPPEEEPGAAERPS